MNSDNIKRGDIYLAELDPVIGSEQGGQRPVVVVQNDLANKYNPTIIIAPITSVLKKKKLSTHILIRKNKYLKNDSMILLEQIKTIDKCRLISFIGRLNNNKVNQISNRLLEIFEIDLTDYFCHLEKRKTNKFQEEKLYSEYYDIEKEEE